MVVAAAGAAGAANFGILGATASSADPVGTLDASNVSELAAVPTTAPAPGDPVVVYVDEYVTVPTGAPEGAQVGEGSRSGADRPSSDDRTEDREVDPQPGSTVSSPTLVPRPTTTVIQHDDGHEIEHGGSGTERPDDD